MQGKQWPEAIAQLEALVSDDGAQRTPQRLLFQCYLRVSRYASAVALCQRMDAASNPDLPYLLAKAHYLQAQYPVALEYLDNPVAQASHADAPLMLVRTLVALKRQDDATSRATLLAACPDISRLIAARCWEAAGAVLQAEQAYEEHLASACDAVGWAALLKCQLNAREWGRAWQTIARAGELGIDGPVFAEARERLSSAFQAAALAPPSSTTRDELSRYRSSEMIVTAIVDRVLKRAHDDDRFSKRQTDRSPKRVVLIIDALGPGGAQRQLVNLANALVSGTAVCEIVVLCTYLERSERDRFYIDQLDSRVTVECYFDRHKVVTVGRLSPLAGFSNLLEHLQPVSRQQLLLQLSERLAELQPDAVQGWLDETFINTALAGSMLGIPVITGRWGNTPPGVGKSMTECQRSNVAYQIHAFKAIARLPGIRYSSNSAANGEAYARLIGLHPEKVVTIHNGIDERALLNDARAEPDLRSQLGIPEQAAVVGTIIRFVAQKRPLLWIESALLVAARHPDVHFVLLGAGDQESAMRALTVASPLEGRIHFAGTHRNVGAWLNMMNIFLLTSRIEGIPNAAIEAQVMGCALVAPDVGGLSEAMVPGSTGLLLTDHRAESFAGAIMLLLELPQRLARFQSQAQRHARARFSIDALASAHRRFFDLDKAQVGRTFDAQELERSSERPLLVDEAVRQDIGHVERLYGKLDRLSSTTQPDDTLQ